MPVESFRIEGLKGVIDTLKSLPPELVSRRGGPIRTALRKAAKVIQDEAKLNVRNIVAEPNLGGVPTRSTGALEKSITIKRRRPRAGVNGEVFTVGISKVKGTYGDTKKNRRSGKVGNQYDQLPPTFYAWFLEFGTERMRAHPFMRPAFDAKKQEAVDTFVTETNKGIERVYKKLKRQNRVKE